MEARLYVVPTPIGNLEDMTHRAVAVLRQVDLILCEDTRTSSRLLRHYDIHTPFESFHMHNEHQKVGHYLQMLQEGKQLAQISDAGTPGISDPGFLLVREAVKAGIALSTLPGATAVIPALVNSALPNHQFTFEGFLPVKKGRQTRLKTLAQETRTMVFYESPHRVLRTLCDMMEVFGPDRAASYSREISKRYEETERGTLLELAQSLELKGAKGEYVLCVSGA